jgi:hypothetical protein
MWLHVELEMLGVPYVVLDQANEPCPQHARDPRCTAQVVAIAPTISKWHATNLEWFPSPRTCPSLRLARKRSWSMRKPFSTVALVFMTSPLKRGHCIISEGSLFLDGGSGRDLIISEGSLAGLSLAGTRPWSMASTSIEQRSPGFAARGDAMP